MRHCLTTFVLLLGLVLSSAVAEDYDEEDVATLQLRLRTMKQRQKEGRYVDPEEMGRLEAAINKRPGDARKTSLKAKTLKETSLTQEVLGELKTRATDFVKENAYDFIKDKVEEHKQQLLEDIRRAKTARQVAEYIERYTYSKNAPKGKASLAKFYNYVYHEQGWIGRNLGRKIADKEKRLRIISRLEKVEQGFQKAQEMKEKAQQKIQELQAKIETKLGDATGVDIELLKGKLEQYKEYYDQAVGWAEYCRDLKSQADTAANAAPDLPENARQGLRNMVYIGEALNKLADKADLPGVSDMLRFYADATKVSQVAAKNAQRFKLGHGEIDSANQLFGVYNDALKTIGTESATMTEFGKETGVRIILDNKRGGGYYLLDDKYNVLNVKPLSAEDFKALRALYANYDGARKQGDNPLSPRELMAALAQMRNGKDVIIRGKSYGKNARSLAFDAQMEFEVAMNNTAAADLYAKLKPHLPEGWGEWALGRDNAEYVKRLNRLMGEWTGYDEGKLGMSTDEIARRILAALKEGKSFDAIIAELEKEAREGPKDEKDKKDPKDKDKKDKDNKDKDNKDKKDKDKKDKDKKDKDKDKDDERDKDKDAKPDKDDEEGKGVDIFEEAKKPDVRDHAGRRVDPDRYGEGDRVITKEGIEYVQEDGTWRTTGRKYDAYEPDEDGAGGIDPLAEVYTGKDTDKDAEAPKPPPKRPPKRPSRPPPVPDDEDAGGQDDYDGTYKGNVQDKTQVIRIAGGRVTVTLDRARGTGRIGDDGAFSAAWKGVIGTAQVAYGGKAVDVNHMADIRWKGQVRGDRATGTTTIRAWVEGQGGEETVSFRWSASR